MRYLKQFGLQRSGTNAVKAIIEMNFRDVVVLSNYLGDKHDASSWEIMFDNLRFQDPADYDVSSKDGSKIKTLVNKQELPIIINVKDPVSWVNSYFKYQRKKVLYKNPEADFEFTVEFSKKVLARYEQVVKSWLNLAKGNEKVVFFTHEEVVSGLSKPKLEKLKELLDASVTDNYPLLRVDGYAKRGIDTQHGSDLINEKIDFDRNYHLAGGWRAEVPDEVFQFCQIQASRIFEEIPGLREILDCR